MGTDLAAARRKVDKLLARQSLAQATVKNEKIARDAAEARLRAAREAQEILQQVAQDIQSKAHEKIASVVSRCLRTVFGPKDHQFRINFVQKRGKTEAELVFVKNGKEIDPKEGSGGGTVDIAAFALRLVCLLLSRPQRRKLLVMDEPFSAVNGEVYQERTADLLLELSKEFGIQVILAADDDFLKLGKVIDLDQV